MGNGQTTAQVGEDQQRELARRIASAIELADEAGEHLVAALLSEAQDAFQRPTVERS